MVLERWSRGTSPLHRRDARAKIGALLVLLVAVATAQRALPVYSAALLVTLAAGLAWARIPLGSAVARAATVLPFTGVFALISWLAGDPARAASYLLKSYLSALAVLLVVATTPLPALVRGMEGLGVPRFLLAVSQFLYRYLFVISGEAQHMRHASAARGASARHWMGTGLRFRAAAGALAVLFGRAYGRAENVHRAMLARGFQGRAESLRRPRFRTADAVFLAAASLLPILLRVAAERVAG